MTVNTVTTVCFCLSNLLGRCKAQRSDHHICHVLFKKLSELEVTWGHVRSHGIILESATPWTWDSNCKVLHVHLFVSCRPDNHGNLNVKSCYRRWISWMKIWIFISERACHSAVNIVVNTRYNVAVNGRKMISSKSHDKHFEKSTRFFINHQKCIFHCFC